MISHQRTEAVVCLVYKHTTYVQTVVNNCVFTICISYQTCSIRNHIALVVGFGIRCYINCSTVHTVSNLQFSSISASNNTTCSIVVCRSVRYTCRIPTIIHCCITIYQTDETTNVSTACRYNDRIIGVNAIKCSTICTTDNCRHCCTSNNS